MLAALLSPPSVHAASDTLAVSGVLWLAAGVLLGGLTGYAVARRGRCADETHPAVATDAAASERAPAVLGLEGLNRALQESVERYRDMLESVSEVIFRIDQQGHLLFLNGAWKRLSGYEIGMSLGRPLIDFLHPDDRTLARDKFVPLATGESRECHCQLRLRTRSGEIRWIELTGRVVEEPGRAGWSLAGTLDDISSRKVAELTLKNLNQELESRVRLRTAELEASTRELEAFSYSVSHDLRAPLRAIDGFARILEDDLAERLDDTTRSHLNRIRKAAERMADLIDALIALATLSRQPLRKESLDLSALATLIIDELRAENPERQVDVEITAGLVVTADRVLMHAMLDNLLRNAWKFSSRRPRARIAFRAELDGERRVFCVEDNGAGFDMKFATKLFHPFQRLHNSHDFPGTGIGLATVQRIVQRHEGTIWAESTPDAGSKFYFTLGR